MNTTQEPGLDAAGLEAALAAAASEQSDYFTLDAKIIAAIHAYEAHRSGAGEPVAWQCKHRPDLFVRPEDYEIKYAGFKAQYRPLYASPAKAGELEELRRVAEVNLERAENQWKQWEARAEASEARARRMEEALRFYASGSEFGPDLGPANAWMKGLNSAGLGCRYATESLVQDQGSIASAALSDSPASVATKKVQYGCSLCGGDGSIKGRRCTECDGAGVHYYTPPASAARPAGEAFRDFVQQMARFTTPEEEFEANDGEIDGMTYEDVDDMLSDISDDRLLDEYGTFMDMVRQAKELAK